MKFRIILSFFLIILLVGCTQKENIDKETTSDNIVVSSLSNTKNPISSDTPTESSSNAPLKTENTQINNTNYPTTHVAHTQFPRLPQESVTKLFNDYNNQNHYSQYISTKHNELNIVGDYIFVENLDDMSKGFFVPYDAVNSEYPVECARKINNNIYVLYETSEGGLFYVFFNQNMNIKYTSYATKRLSYNDFMVLKLGDSITKAEAIEPAIKTIKGFFISPEPPIEDFYYVTNHILTDGALRIIYIKDYKNNDYIIHKIIYSPNFIIDTDENHSDQLNFKVLDSDYIN